MDLSSSTRDIIASAKMEGVDLSERTIADLEKIEAGTKTAEESIADYLDARLPLAGR